MEKRKMADVKRIVAHPRYYRTVKGKCELIPKGTELLLSEKEAERLRGKVIDPAKRKSLDVATGKTVDDSATIAALQADLAKANKALEAMAKAPKK
jgi:hypothetical protein